MVTIKSNCIYKTSKRVEGVRVNTYEEACECLDNVLNGLDKKAVVEITDTKEHFTIYYYNNCWKNKKLALERLKRYFKGE